MKKTIKTLSLAVTAYCLLLTANCMAQTTTLCNFDFNGSSSLPVSAASTASNITASVNSAVANAAYGGTATGSSAFTQNATAGDALSMANSSGNNTNYWTLTLGGSALNNYMAYHIYFQGEHSTTGATAITVSWSTDGSTYTALSQTIAPGLNNTFTEAFVDLSSINALNGASNIYVRFAASVASSTGTLRMDNLQVQGSLSPFEISGSNVTFNGTVTVPTLTVSGNAKVNGNLTSGAATVSSLSSGNVNSSGNLSVIGTTSLTGAVTTGALTSGATTVGSLSNNGNLSVTGTTTLTGAVTTGTINATNLNISGSTTFNQINASQSIKVPTIIASRITSGDTNGVHIGDSSMAVSYTHLT